jgi:hypothetical protein
MEHLFSLDKDTILKIIPLFISAFALAISILSYMRSKHPLNERKLVLYAKCNALYWDLQRFSGDELNPDIWEGERFFYFQIKPVIWDQYIIESNELVELALMDIKMNSHGMEMVGLPHRLAQWYHGNSLEFKKYEEDWYRISAAEKKYEEITEVVWNLMADLKKVMKYLESDFFLRHRFLIEKNKLTRKISSRRSIKLFEKRQKEGWKGRSKEEVQEAERNERRKLFEAAHKD